MASGWEYIITNSMTMEVIGKIRNAHDRSLSVDLNKSGSASCWLPISDPLSASAWPWSTALVAQYDNTWFWSGPLVQRKTNMAQGQVTISAVGWFERLMHLTIQDVNGASYSNQDAGAIVADLLDKAADQDPHLQITLGTVETTQPRTITYNLDQSIGQAILDLADLESGYDWYIDPITRELNIVAQLGTVRPECRWMFLGDGKSRQSNLANVEETVDGSTLVNQMRTRGQFGSGYADDPASMNTYGVFQEAPSLSDVVDPVVLVAYAGAEIFYRSQPRVTYDLTPKPSSKATVPKLFRDFNIGDVGYLTARRGIVDVRDQPVRAFGATLAINDAGTETITNLQTTAN
jgi:hypothetical protein